MGGTMRETAAPREALEPRWHEYGQVHLNLRRARGPRRSSVRVRRPVAGPCQIAATVLYAHIVLLAAVMYQAGFGWIPDVGTHFVNKSERSAAIDGLQGVSSAGYDGEFAYFIALDPIHARYYMDD